MAKAKSDVVGYFERICFSIPRESDEWSENFGLYDWLKFPKLDIDPDADSSYDVKVLERIAIGGGNSAYDVDKKCKNWVKKNEKDFDYGVIIANNDANDVVVIASRVVIVDNTLPDEEMVYSEYFAFGKTDEDGFCADPTTLDTLVMLIANLESTYKAEARPDIERVDFREWCDDVAECDLFHIAERDVDIFRKSVDAYCDSGCPHCGSYGFRRSVH